MNATVDDCWFRKCDCDISWCELVEFVELEGEIVYPLRNYYAILLCQNLKAGHKMCCWIVTRCGYRTMLVIMLINLVEPI